MLEQLKEDIKQYNETLEIYNQLETEDIDLAYDLAKESLLLANRWNEIMLDSAKYCTLLDTKKTSFES